MKIAAEATRDGKWWVARFSIDGKPYGTQAKTLSKLSDMVADVADMLGHKDVDVAIIPEVSTYEDEIISYKALARKANLAEVEAAKASRVVVAHMRDDGLTVRDAATLLGLSPSRVSQLTKG